MVKPPSSLYPVTAVTTAVLTILIEAGIIQRWLMWLVVPLAAYLVLGLFEGEDTNRLRTKCARRKIFGHDD